MSINVNKSNFDINKKLLDKDAILVYEILTETIVQLEEECKIILNDSLTFSTENGSLKDEHNGKIYFRALSGLKQLIKYQIIKGFFETDVSNGTTHTIKFDIS